jgi:hypothetical protein
MLDDLDLEIDFDRVEADSADRELPWSARRRSVIARAFASPSLRPRAQAVVQAHLMSWIAQAPEVIAARAAAPSWDAFRRLRSAQDQYCQRSFSTSWWALMHWQCGTVATTATTAWSASPPVPSRWLTSGGQSLQWREAIAAIVPAALRDRIVVEFDGLVRPHTAIDGNRAIMILRDQVEGPRAWFHLMHELGHALAGLLWPGPLPRVVDESVAAWMARHLEDPSSSAGLPAQAWSAPELQRSERRRRTDLAAMLSDLEAAPATAQQQLAACNGSAAIAPVLPWALWHDSGAQPAYLGAELRAESWWSQGLRADDPAGLRHAIARACGEIAAAAPPFVAIVSRTPSRGL